MDIHHSEIELIVKADADRVIQMVTNLEHNVIKFGLDNELSKPSPWAYRPE